MSFLRRLFAFNCDSALSTVPAARRDVSSSYGIRGVLLERRDHVREMRALLIDVCLRERHLSAAIMNLEVGSRNGWRIAAAAAAVAMTCGTAHVAVKQPKKAAFDWTVSSSSQLRAHLRRRREGLWLHSSTRTIDNHICTRREHTDDHSATPGAFGL